MDTTRVADDRTRLARRIRAAGAPAAVVAAAAILLAACTSYGSAAGAGGGAAAIATTAPAAPAATTDLTAGGGYGGNGEGAAASAAPASSAEAEGGGEAYEVGTATVATVGPYLTGEKGMTLYVFKKDSPSQSACTDQCAVNWPPFTLEAGETVKGAAGIGGTFGTITRADGTTQVTYNDMPLYYYAADRKAGDVVGQGVGGVWFAAAP